MDFYEPPVSLWGIIKANTGAVELDELRLILGPADVDLSLDLRLEVESLLEIWRALRDEKKGSTALQFVDQSEVRKRLVSEIKLFIDSIKENPDMMGVVRVEKLSARPVVRSALAEYDRSFHRTSTSFGSDGRDTPTALGSPSRSTPSRASSQLSFEDICQLKDRFKIDHVLEILQHLRSYLAEEIAQLKEDAEFLRNSIEEENNIMTLSSDRPTLAELRCERNEMEAELRWATDNAALLRPLPPPSKRHGSLLPLEKGDNNNSTVSSRPSSAASSVSTITTQLAQATTISSSSITPPPPPMSPIQTNLDAVSPVSSSSDDDKYDYESKPHALVSPINTTLITEQDAVLPPPQQPHPPTELRPANIRMVSGSKATTQMRSYVYKQAVVLPSKSVALPTSNKPNKNNKNNNNKETVVVTGRPPLPPTTRRSVKSNSDN